MLRRRDPEETIKKAQLPIAKKHFEQWRPNRKISNSRRSTRPEIHIHLLSHQRTAIWHFHV